MKKSTNRVYGELPDWKKAEKKLGKKMYRKVICKYLDDLLKTNISSHYDYRNNSAIEEQIELLLSLKVK